jgi:serine/threonine-protein kinase
MLLVPAVIDTLIGQVIDKKYRLMSLSGQGTGGRVYKAWHESIGRPVAIKVAAPASDAASSKAVECMKREARALSLVNHPNIPRLFDGGELDDGSTYLVLDYFDGLSLLEHIELKGYIPAEQAVQMFSQICDALDYLHAHGLVHRDIKPENIIVLNRNQGKITVKLIDFGICKLDEPGVETANSQAAKIELMGSPLYMSPEHVNASLVDKRSDIYSLGATVYHALSGRPPLSENTLIDIVHAHRSVMPTPISVVRPEAQVSPALEAVVFRAVQKFPGNRFQSAAEMKVALQRAMTGETFTGRLLDLQFSGAELRAIIAFVKSGDLQQVQNLLGLQEELTEAIQHSLLEKLKLALQRFESTHAPSGESLEELAMEHTAVTN